MNGGHVFFPKRLLLAGLVLLLATSAARAQERPPNDDLSDAIELLGTNVVASGSNVGATREEGEAALSPRAAGKTVWWKWTAPRGGSVQVDTFGSSFDTLLRLYRLQDGVPVALFGTADDALGGSRPTLAATTTSPVNEGATYLIAIDGYGAAEGDIQIRLTYGTPVRILVQPASQTVGLGGALNLSVQSLGHPPLTYQWEKDGQPITGATADTLAIAPVQSGDAGTYRVAVTNGLGGEISADAVVTVLPLAITHPPTNLTIAPGYDGQLSVVASGQPPFHHIWTKDGAEIPAASAATLSLPGDSLSRAGTYRVTVTNVYGAVTSAPVTVSVNPPWTWVTFAGANSAGSQNGTGTVARFNSPHGIAVGPDGTLYVSEIGGHTIRRIGTNCAVTTLAGSAGQAGFSDGVGDAARFRAPWGLCVDPAGNVLVADSQNRVIRKITPEGLVTTVAGTPTQGAYVGGQGGFLDGPAATARFEFPVAVVAAPSGDVFVADYYNQAIRRISPEGQVSTWAGKPVTSVGIFGQPAVIDGFAENAVFNLPVGLALAPDGTLFVADEYNHAIRRISPDRQVTTVMGGRAGGNADGDITTGQLRLPHGPALGPDGSIFVPDFSNYTIRQITPEGQLITIGGNPSRRALVNGSGSTTRFQGPRSMVMGPEGCLYVTDLENHVIRKGVPSPLVLVTNPPSRVVQAGQPVSMGVLAAGLPALGYQWLKDGEPLPGKTTASLSLGSANNRALAGAYSVVVTNQFLSVTSPPARVDIVIRQQVHPPELLPEGGVRLRFGDEVGDGLPPLDRLELQWRPTLPQDDDTEWQTITSGFRVEEGFIVLDLPPDASPTNRFFRVVER